MIRQYKALRKFGLTNNEIKVYLESLKLNETSPYELSRLTKIPRTTVYDVLMSLALKGLVELEQSDGLQKQQTKIKAINPSKLRQIINKRRQKLTDLEVDILEILPELKGDYQKDKANADFRFYPGIEGAKKVYFDNSIYQSHQPEYVWTHLMPVDVFGTKAVNELVKKQSEAIEQSQGSVKRLVPLNDWTKHVISYQLGKNANYLKRQFRYIDNPIFKTYLHLSIAGTRVRISCADKEEVWGLVINSQALSKTLRSIFELTWQLATPITSNIVKSWGENQFLKQEKKKQK